jgi:hypothetical protein
MTIEGDAAKTLDSISQSAKGTDQQLAGISKTAPAMGKALKVGAGVGLAAVAAMAAGVVKASKDTIKLAGDLNSLAKQARSVNALASEIDTLNGAFGLLTENGIDSARVLEDVNLNLGKAAAGSAEAQRAFDELGLPDDFAGRDAISRVSMLVERVGAISDPARRAEIASKTLGRSWRELQTVFESGEGALEGAIEQIRAAGVVSDETATQSEALIDAVDLASRTFEGLKRDALEPLIPVLTETFETVRELLQGLDPQAVDHFAGRLSRLVGTLADVAAGAFKATMSFLGLAAAQGDEGAKSAQAAIIAQAEQIDQLKEQIRVSKEVDSVTGGLSDETRKLTAELEKEIAVLGRLRGEIGAIAGLGGAAPTRATDGGRRAAPRGGGAPAATGGGGGGATTADVMPSTLLTGVQQMGPAISVVTDEVVSLGSALYEAELSFQEFRGTWEEGTGTIVAAIGQLAITVLDEIAASQRRAMNESIAAAEETAKEIASIERKLSESISEEEKRKLLEEKKRLEERSEAEREAALEAFHTNKALAVVSASLATALAVIQAVATAPNIIAGIALAVVAGAMGAVSIAKIAAQQPPEFARGGVLREGDVPMVGGQVHTRMEPGEGVLTKQGLRNVGGARALEDLNAGRAGGGGGVVVMRVGPRTTEAIAVEQLRPRSGHLATALRTARPKHGRRVAGR